jgi:hypothetical protein
MRWSLQAREARRLETNAQASKEIRRRSRAMRSRMTCGFVVQQHLISPSAIGHRHDRGRRNRVDGWRSGCRSRRLVVHPSFRILSASQFGRWLRFKSPLVKLDVRMLRPSVSERFSSAICRTGGLCLPIAVATSDGCVARWICG